MTNKERTMYKRAAQEAMKENGMKVFQKDIILLESGSTADTFMGDTIIFPDYVMFEDRKTGKQWQCRYGARYYNPELDTLWEVEEYIA